jgi:hypothetical protein
MAATRWPDHLLRMDIEHDLTDDEKKCPGCGEARRSIGQKELGFADRH